MAWKVEIDRQAVKDLDRIDRQEARRILVYLFERVARLEDPRSLGEALKGPLGGLWKYRLGAYRIIAEIRDADILVLVVRIGHRSKVYGGH